MKGRVNVGSQRSVTYVVAIEILRARGALLEICAGFSAVDELRFLPTREGFVEGRCVMVSLTGSDVGWGTSTVRTFPI
jgi:hypothetical protein